MTDTTPDQGDERRAFEAAYRFRYNVPADAPLSFPDVGQLWNWWRIARAPLLAAAHPVAQEEKPVAWRYIPSKAWGAYVLTDDKERAQLARDNGCTVYPLFLAAPQPSQGANVKVGGSTVYVTNNHRRESNRWWATVYPGFDDDDKRVSTEECDAIANWIADALNAAPHPPVSAEAGKGVVHQFRKKHCSDWYDGFPDTEDGGGPYETRTLYVHPSESVAVSAAPSALPAQAMGEKESVEPWVDGNGVIRTGVLPDAPQEAAEMTEEAVRLWLAQRGRMSVPRSDYLKAIAPASLREAQIQAVASAVDACEERGCKECAGMLRGEIHRLRVWAFKDSRSAPQEASKAEGDCPGCGGLGRVRVLRCEQCDGTGKILASPSKEASKVEPVADEPFGWFSAFRDGSEDFIRKTESQPYPAYEDEPTHCIALYLRPSQQAPCEHCDDTGDVHGYDGEWRGYCECHAGVRLHRDALLKTITTHPSQQALSDEEIIDLARVASTVNNYSNGRFASAIFEREHAIAFARAILAAAGGSEK